MLFVATPAPLLRATIMAVLIQLRQPVSCVLSYKNVPSLTKTVKPQTVTQIVLNRELLRGGKFFISQHAESVQLWSSYRYSG